jgi:hypothetical protein
LLFIRYCIFIHEGPSVVKSKRSADLKDFASTNRGGTGAGNTNRRRDLGD